MKVFNLTEQYVDYRKKTLPPFGSLDYDMDFIPDRDLGLQKAGVLAFGALPKGWTKPAPPMPAPVVPPAPKAAPPKPFEVVSPGSSSKVEFVSEKEEKKNRK